MIKMCLCDDDIGSSEYYKDLIEKTKFEAKVTIRTYKSGESLMFNIEDQIEEIDILVIDIEMGEINGIEAVKKLRNKGYQGEVVYLSSVKDYVFETFQTKPLDYLIKSSEDDKKFVKTMKKAVAKAVENKKEFLILGSSDRSKVCKREILYIESMARKMCIHTIKNETIECYMNVGEMLEMVEGDSFARVHKSFLVNFEHVKGMDKGVIYLANEVSLPMGRGFAVEAKEMLAITLEKDMVKS